MAQAVQACVVPLQMGVAPLHWLSAVHWFVRLKLAVIGAVGVDAITE